MNAIFVVLVNLRPFEFKINMIQLILYMEKNNSNI